MRSPSPVKKLAMLGSTLTRGRLYPSPSGFFLQPSGFVDNLAIFVTSNLIEFVKSLPSCGSLRDLVILFNKNISTVTKAFADVLPLCNSLESVKYGSIEWVNEGHSILPIARCLTRFNHIKYLCLDPQSIANLEQFVSIVISAYNPVNEFHFSIPHEESLHHALRRMDCHRFLMGHFKYSASKECKIMIALTSPGCIPRIGQRTGLLGRIPDELLKVLGEFLLVRPKLEPRINKWATF
ncbi:hypothetical protein BASA62_003430 [Batrachochytrium salamandrivorans]|nr:hypothetical protein BASA62_003430 [Batrachochytrium salamandrivorans]